MTKALAPVKHFDGISCKVTRKQRPWNKLLSLGRAELPGGTFRQTFGRKGRFSVGECPQSLTDLKVNLVGQAIVMVDEQSPMKRFKAIVHVNLPACQFSD
jgi:hypothetical protein